MSYLFFVPGEEINNDANSAILGADEWKHAAKVLRLKVGDKLDFFNGQGGLYKAEIFKEVGKAFSLKILSGHQTKISYELAVYIGLPKSGKIDSIVNSLTQLGATTIGTFSSRFAIAKPGRAEKIERLKKTTIEACKQSSRTWLPLLELNITFEKVLQKVKSSKKSVVFYEKAPDYLPNSVYQGKELLLIIGPEGGLAEKEIEQMKQAGAQVSLLSDAILRVETAALAAAQLARYNQLSLLG